jgi:AraC-like DNA-binding protein
VSAVVAGVASAGAAPGLAAYVHGLFGVCSSGAPERRLESPVAGTALIIALEHGWRVAASEDAPLQRVGSFAGGLTVAPAVSEHDGYAHSVQLDLSPLGTAAVLGVPGAEVAGRIVAFEDLVGERAARLLAEQLAELGDWPARFAALQSWAARRIAAARPASADVAWALGRLDATGGRVRVAEVQRELGCSRRHLAARFGEDVGCSPKTYARLVRFTRARDAICHTPEPLAGIAVACGYSDQAHLTREVHAFSGATPAALRHASTPVTFLQAAAL